MNLVSSVFRSKGVVRFLSIPAVVVVALFFVLPCLVLILDSFGWPNWTLEGYLKDILDPTIATVMIRTFLISAAVTLTALIIGFPYAYLMTQVSPRVRIFMIAIVLVPFWTSLLARTFAWMVIFQVNGPWQKILEFFGIQSEPLLGTSTGVLISMTQVLLPFMILPLYASLSGIDSNYLRASSALGANGWQTFSRVYAPLALGGVAAGTLLVFILSLGFYITPRIIGSPQQAMIGQIIAMRVDQFLDFSGAGVLSMLLILAFLVTMAALGLVLATTRLFRTSWK
jgi:putative spermidine/putrescine transport system permease protein